MTVDPDVAETGQPYAYTGDDPVNGTDPLGLFWGEGTLDKWRHDVASNVDANWNGIKSFATGLVGTPSGCKTNRAAYDAGNITWWADAIGGLFGDGTTGGTGNDDGNVAEEPPASVETPYGAVLQEDSSAATAARSQVERGATVYRIGTTLKSQATEGQFWSLESPFTPGYAARYGLPAENVADADFVESGVVPEGTAFITRSAPGIGDNPGGGIEVVVPAGGVRSMGFSYLGPKGLEP